MDARSRAAQICTLTGPGLAAWRPGCPVLSRDGEKVVLGRGFLWGRGSCPLETKNENQLPLNPLADTSTRPRACRGAQPTTRTSPASVSLHRSGHVRTRREPRLIAGPHRRPPDLGHPPRQRAVEESHCIFWPQHSQPCRLALAPCVGLREHTSSRGCPHPLQLS